MLAAAALSTSHIFPGTAKVETTQAHVFRINDTKMII